MESGYPVAQETGWRGCFSVTRGFCYSLGFLFFPFRVLVFLSLGNTIPFISPIVFIFLFHVRHRLWPCLCWLESLHHGSCFWLCPWLFSLLKVILCKWVIEVSTLDPRWEVQGEHWLEPKELFSFLLGLYRWTLNFDVETGFCSLFFIKQKLNL